METASLRIKFTPLLKESCKNCSKCCLEIVPEVSCIENLENIEWKKKTDFLEYTIPMTYKVIIKKQQRVEESSHNLEKFYHSCVDLLTPSSLTGIELCSGDMTRMISDTFINDNLIARIQNKKALNVTSLKQVNQHDLSVYANIDKLDQLSNDVTSYVEKQTNNSIKPNVDANTAISKQIIDINETDHNSVKQVTNSTSELHLCQYMKSESIESINDIYTESNKEGSLRKLSITPIYSIDTNDHFVSESFSILSCDSVVGGIFAPQKFGSGTVRIKELPFNDDATIVSNKNKVRCRGGVEGLLYKERKRELPEIRVAKFVKIMEAEIMPLKLMLHDIFRKCSFLGLTKNKKKYFDSHQIIYQNVTYDSKQVVNTSMIKYCKKQRSNEKQNKCNRVVYSVVCDG